jgi:D-amino-acid dehydrogenase
MSDRVKGQTANVIVLGARIVGVSAAYAVWQRGLSVILIDRREPGSETSYGNAVFSAAVRYRRSTSQLCVPKTLNPTIVVMKVRPGWRVNE